MTWTLDPADPAVAAWAANRAAWRRWTAAAKARRAVAAGRSPGQTGRPRTSDHPRAEYWRNRYARMRAAGSN